MRLPSCILFFTIKAYLPKFRIEKLLLDSAHDACPVYEYGRRENIFPFIDLNSEHTGHFIYKDNFTIDDDGVPVYKMDLHMHKDGYEAAKHRTKYCRLKADLRQTPSVNIPVPLLNTTGRYIFILAIQDCLAHRQRTLKHGKRNMM